MVCQCAGQADGQPRVVELAVEVDNAAPQALRLYAQGRRSLTDGETGDAVTAFQAAARLDPGSTETRPDGRTLMR